MAASQRASVLDGTQPRNGVARSQSATPAARLGPRYKWIALSNTTLGILMVTINSSITMIAMPDIFKGIHINPLAPGNTSYLLWMMMGFLVVTAVLVVGFGRLGDMYGRVRMYNLGFAIFAISSVFLWVTWFDGTAAALWLIGWRVVQGIGGAFLFANSSAILTDAFPTNQRGLALGINGVAAISGSFLGLLIGGVLAPINWHFVFLVSVPFGVFGAIWAYLKLRDNGMRQKAEMDWWGNITFAVGLIAVLTGITYGIQPYGGHTMGWTSPWVLSALIGGGVILLIFVVIQNKVSNPLFDLSLFRIRAFTAGNIANLMASLSRGGLQFVLIMWLQGIWLPQHGYSFEQTPLWAGIYMLPLTIGFLVAAPLSGALSDRWGGRALSAGGMVVSAVSFVLLAQLPADFDYWTFAVLLLVNGLGMGLFSSPNRADVMNSLPPHARGVGAGMNATFQNSATVLSIGFFMSLMIAGVASNLPSAMYTGLVAHAVPASDAHTISQLPPVGVLFAAFLGYNPVQQLLGPILNQLPPDQATYLTGRGFFPQLISGPFADGLGAAFTFAIVACAIAAIASVFTGPTKRVAAVPAAGARMEHHESVGSMLAAVASESGTSPAELVSDSDYVARGTVRTQGGAPVRGAVVVVIGPDGRRADRVLVASDGGYTLAGLPPGGYTVTVTASGFQPQAAALTVNGRGPATCDFVLEGGGGVVGTVRVHDDDAVVGGATVVAISADGQVLGQTVTGPDGRYQMDGLGEGEITLTACAPDRMPAAVRLTVAFGKQTTADLVVGSAGELRGTVSAPYGAPLHGATVTLIDSAGHVIDTTSTGPDGQYRLAGLPGGEYTVLTSAYVPTAVQVRIAMGEASTLDLALGHDGGDVAKVRR